MKIQWLKILDIAWKDIAHSMRSTIGLAFMLVIPLVVTGMFYFMLGSSLKKGEFILPRVSVVVANLDQDAPHLGGGRATGDFQADTLSGLVIEVLQSDDLADLLSVSLVSDAAAARAAVDQQQAQVAVIIPPDFSRQFADLDGQAEIEFYQDPTLTIGPGIVKSFLNQFMNSLSGVKIAAGVTQDLARHQPEAAREALLGQVLMTYLDSSAAQVEDPAEELLAVQAPIPAAAGQDDNRLLALIGPIMGGMMIFYAFYTGAASGQSILQEEERLTLPRLFTTPTPQSTILSGKFLSVFLTVLIQVVVLLTISHYLFGIQWGAPGSLALLVASLVLAAASFGIFINSLFKSTKQSGALFGGVIAMTGMLGMIRIFAIGSPAAETLGNTVSLLVPQGWATRAVLELFNGRPVPEIGLSCLALLAWAAAFFLVGVWRFNRRYV